MFKFKFESILKLKQQMEKKAQNELAIANERLIKEKEKLKDLIKARESAFEEMKSESGLIDVLKLRDYSKYLERLKLQIQRQENKVNQEQRNVDILSEKLKEALKNRKIFEKLKEKKHEEFVNEQNKKEQLLADEVVSYKQKSKNTEQ